MEKKTNKKETCAVCGKSFLPQDLIPANSIRNQLTDLIIGDFPGWNKTSSICEFDLGEYREKYIQKILLEEKGNLTALEKEVVKNMRNNEVINRNMEHQLDHDWSWGERLSDKIADFGGSWTFIIIFGVFMALWITGNALVLLFHPFDPYPFILLNLILSTLAAIQAPIIMMSQNRQEAKDRLRSQHDYKVNLKAEIEIRTLHEKIDHLLTYQWKRLVEIQEMQMELLTKISKKENK